MGLLMGQKDMVKGKHVGPCLGPSTGSLALGHLDMG